MNISVLLAWAKEKCKIGFDKNPEFVRKSEKEMEEAFEFVVKSMVIIKDLYQGNPNLPEGREEEAIGFNAIAGGFQGKDSGPIISPILILQKLCSILPLTGKARVSRLLPQLKMTV